MKKMKKKANCTIEMDADLLLDFRRILFEYGIGIEAFVQYIARKATVREDFILDLINQASIERKDKFLQQEFLGKRKEVDKNVLYALIQEELTKTKQEDASEISNNEES